MHADKELLVALTLVLGAAAVTTIVFRVIRQPLVLGYLLAGFVIGPHLPVPLVADPNTVETLSELGVVLLMFFLGLEFSLRRLFRVGPTVLFTAVVQCSLLFWLGFAAGRSFGWTSLESLFTGAVIAISSTTIIAKAFEEAGIGGKLRELVVGVLLVEDLIAVVLIAVLTAVATGAGLSAGALARVVGRLGAFLVALVLVGMFVVPRAIRALTRKTRPETVTVATVGLCFGVALLAREAGYSVALGAFLAGSLVAESGEGPGIERLVQPLRDVFGAVFFVSVGMMFDPSIIAQNLVPVLVLTVVVILGKIASVSLGAFLAGSGTRTSLQAGMSLAQIGEFSFIIASVGVALGATRPFLFAVAVAVSSITTLLTPWLIRASGPVAKFIDRKLPPRLQTFGALYGSWLERVRPQGAPKSTVRRLVRMLLVDVAVLIGVVVVGALGEAWVRRQLVDRLALGPEIAGVLFAAGVAVLCAPFVLGLVSVARRLSRVLALSAFPPVETGPDLAAAPRRALGMALQLAILLLAGIPIVAVTQPFLRGVRGAEVLLLAVFVLTIAMWRMAGDVEGHVRAGAQVIVEALARRSGPGLTREEIPLGAVFAGLGDPVAIELPAESPAVGKTLAELNLRGETGATVLAITRGESAIVMPSSHEALRAGDRLAIAGSHDAVAAARELLHARPSDARSMATVLAGATT